ncbi:carboxylating nicotinate-nucleotide diphosphorylase [Candidatus Acetothermia bacterium]|nr:carboxylating nicotinate-nucleotide diphosphorylase [Candidatus Acetothermia bacterium]MBI3643968.1 carboxylating nicotinate-nucleotide diphosphorylase [Candidatus Acetothermia bacterium]
MAEAHSLTARARALLDPLKLDEVVLRALAEDLGSGDITTEAIFSDEVASAVILAKAPGVIAGLPVAERVFQLVDPEIEFTPHIRDGEKVATGANIATLTGRVASILRAERTALNFLQRMSGIATLTAQIVGEVSQYNVKILDTRKTAPGLRVLDKFAVRAGGGFNHRMGLYDGVLLKDNYIRAAGGIGKAVSLAREHVPMTVKIEVETTTLAEVEEAVQSGAEIIMLDNMRPAQMKQAVDLIDGRALIEASGGVTLENVREVAATGVDFISIGALTHSPKALDLSLEIHDYE